MEWTLTKDGDCLLICEEDSGLEIPLKNFDSLKAVPHTLPKEVIGELVQLGVKCPTEDVDPFGNPVCLEVIITGNAERRSARLHYGICSWSLPIEFAEKLQAAFLMPGVTDS